MDSIDEKAFLSCRKLHTAIFLGNAPTVFENGNLGSLIPNGIFGFHPSDFKIFSLLGNTGFSTPDWMGIPLKS